MFIHTDPTPNPNTMRFLPGMAVTGGGVHEFLNAEQANGRSPLVERLFDIEGVVSVLLGADFVAVSKQENADWTAIKTLVLGVMFEHFSSNQAVLNEAATAHHSPAGHPDFQDTETTLKIKDLLDTRVRPAVARDGGDIEFYNFDRGILWLRMRGACSGCPSSTMTLKMGIENMMRHYVPDVLEVRAVED